MRVLLLVLFFAGSVLAQDQPEPATAACGPKSVKFAVKEDTSGQILAQPEPGKALIYFVQELGAGNCLGACVTRIALDGTWAGALKHNAYFSVSVDPGEHHACMNIQSGSPLGKLVAFVHVSAEAGKIYYVGTRAFVRTSATRLEMRPIDTDEAQHLIASLPLSVAQPKK